MSASRVTEAINKKRMLAALKEHYGNISRACEDLKLTRTCFYNYMKDPKFAEQVDIISEEVLDLAEGKLVKHIKEDNLTATIFLLKTKGKKRGYVEKTESTNFNTSVQLEKDVSNLSDTDLEDLIRKLEK